MEKVVLIAINERLFKAGLIDKETRDRMIREINTTK